MWQAVFCHTPNGYDREILLIEFNFRNIGIVIRRAVVAPEAVVNAKLYVLAGYSRVEYKRHRSGETRNACGGEYAIGLACPVDAVAAGEYFHIARAEVGAIAGIEVIANFKQ